MSAFDQLRRPDVPVSPDPAFAAALRASVEQALDAPVAAEPTTRTNLRRAFRTIAMPTAPTPVAAVAAAAPAAKNPLIPYLAVRDGVAALAFYAEVLGAVEEVRYTGDDGRIGHAELRIGAAKMYLSDEYPEMGVHAPQDGQTPVALHLQVPDVDASVAAAAARGATVLREPADQPYGDRGATIVDPFGHRWMLATPIATPTIEELNETMEGFTVVAGPGAAASVSAPVEVGYITFGFDDTVKAGAFYGGLFGWQTEGGHLGDEYRHIANTALPMGLTPDGSASAPSLYFRVDDVERYAAQVEALGGTVVSRATYESGPNAVCRDDQGREFQLWQPAEGY